MLNIVIIEDEKLTAKDLVRTLSHIDHDIEVVAVLSTVEESLEYFKSNPEPDLIFSDIELPDGNSFEIFKQLNIKTPIVFCTAYNQYALDAFNVFGIDYLLKPFSKTSISKSLNKFKLLKYHTPITPDILNHLNLQDYLQPVESKHSILIYLGDKIIPIKINDIALFAVVHKSLFAFTFDNQDYCITYSMEELEKLCGSLFFRANRQHLINRKSVKNASRYLNRKLLVNLNIHYKQQILVGKLKVTLFLKWLSES